MALATIIAVPSETEAFLMRDIVILSLWKHHRAF